MAIHRLLQKVRKPDSGNGPELEYSEFPKLR
jgi:hypothetical protein